MQHWFFQGEILDMSKQHRDELYCAIYPFVFASNDVRSIFAMSPPLRFFGAHTHMTCHYSRYQLRSHPNSLPCQRKLGLPVTMIDRRTGRSVLTALTPSLIMGHAPLTLNWWFPRT